MTSANSGTNSHSQKPKNVYISDPMAITWAVKYEKFLQTQWDRIPNSVGTILATIAVFIVGSSIRGEWMIILVNLLKAFKPNEIQPPYNADSNITEKHDPYIIYGIDLEPYYLKDWLTYLIISITISYVFFFGIGGFLHWYYYVRRRDRPEEWKCQPTKWLSPELERHEIMLGSFSLSLGSIVSSLLSCYIMNGGWTTIYYNISDYGWIWYFLSWPMLFFCQDYATYWHHRFYHYPFFYKHFHKLHHKYKQPTAFSVTAIHPVEFLHMQFVMISPIFIFPIHYSVLCTCLMYLYYHGIIDHSGINFKAQWWQPWQPDCIFHDNHHQYFHVNFGFNCELWDKIHGTYRQKDKIYTEDIYFGKGKSLDICSQKELELDLEERKAENILAYRGNVRDEQISVINNKLKIT